MNINNVPPKPQAPSNTDERRWEHSALRRRLLTGLWEQDLENELLRHLPTDRREALGPSDMSSCAIEQVTRQLAMLYHSEPNVTGDGDISALVGRDGYVTKAGFFQLMQKVQQMTLGIREMFVRVDVAPHIPGDVARVPGLSFRSVSPDFVVCAASEDAPDIPLYYQELRLRMHAETGEAVWVWDILDIRNPNEPLFGMYKATPAGGIGEDMSEMYMGHAAMRGESYPYRSKEGVPFLPVVLYHAEKTGQLFNAFDASQLCYGSLVAAVLFSFYVHCVRDNSWPQKYVAGLHLAGLSQLEGDLTGTTLCNLYRSEQHPHVSDRSRHAGTAVDRLLYLCRSREATGINKQVRVSSRNSSRNLVGSIETERRSKIRICTVNLSRRTARSTEKICSCIPTSRRRNALKVCDAVQSFSWCITTRDRIQSCLYSARTISRRDASTARRHHSEIISRTYLSRRCNADYESRS